MKPIEQLFERDGLPRFGLPAALATNYGGDFGLARPLLYANFVSSVDGVVALPGVPESGGVVSGNSEPDRFVMGLLRAFADAMSIGAGTFRAGAGDLKQRTAAQQDTKACACRDGPLNAGSGSGYVRT